MWNPLLLPIFLVWLGTSDGLTQRESFHKVIENKKEYDINEWPHAKMNKRTDVFVQLFINSFGSLNAANMDYSLDTFLRQRWTDPRFALNGTNANRKTTITVTDKKMQDQIWKPDTFFENVKEAAIHQVTMPNVLLRIDSSGGVLYSMRVRLRLACNMDFRGFPLDAQSCGAQIASYANTDNVIKYYWEKEKPIDIPENLEIAMFDLFANSTAEKTYTYVTGNFSGLIVQFSLRRQNGYHVLQTYVPTILIVAISWVSFWLDPNAVPGRVTLGVTTLLTLTTLASGIRSSLPPVSYVKAIDIWVGMCMIMVFGALLEFTFINWLANRKIPTGAIPCKIPGCLLVCSVGVADEEDKEAGTPAKKPVTYIDHARALDRICRGLFPGIFFVFNLFYWPYYLIQQYSTPF